MTEKNLESVLKVKKILRNLSVQDFRNFGLHQIAYIRPATKEIMNGYSVYGADGEKIGTTTTFENALMLVRQENLEPVIVH